MTFIKRNRIIIIGILLGTISGFLYWNWVGCANGSCRITSSPVNSSLYGALLGGLLFSIFQLTTKNK
jgi:hypothetical protein